MIYTTYKKNLPKLPKDSIKLIVMRQPNGVNFISNTNIYWKVELSPSKELLYAYKFEHKYTFEEFEKEFRKELNKNKKAKNLLRKIAKAANKQDIFLICSEVSKFECHRFILCKILKEQFDVDSDEWIGK